MRQYIRIILASAILGWLSLYLFRVVIDGIITGKIHHSDSTKVCKRKSNPIGFWFLVFLFVSFILIFITVWLVVLIDAL